MAKLPPSPPPAVLPRGGHNATAGKANPMDARPGSKNSGDRKQGGVNKAMQASRKHGDR